MNHVRSCVITVNYKGSADTATCVASLLASSVPVFIVVVDNTPDDPELKDALASYPDVKLIRAPKNMGFGQGNNLGIEWALENTDCEYIFTLNNDATVEPDAVNQLESAMDNHADAGIVSARIILAEDPSKLWYGGGEVDWKRGGARVPGWLGPANMSLAMQARYVTFASGCAMMLRRGMLESLGGFDHRFFMYEEDLELSLRVQKNGLLIWYEPNAVILHRGQGSLRQNDQEFMGLLWPDNPNLSFYVFHIIRNRLINMRIHAHGINKIEFMIFFPLFIAKLSLKYIVHRRWDGLRSIIRAFQKV